MEKEKKSINIEELREKYNTLRNKYNLPEFSELNKVFDIEEVDSDSEFLLREVRKIVSERVSGYLRFIEVLFNPSNAPFFFFRFIKNIDNGDRETLERIAEILAKLEFEVISLDLEYNEEKEAEFIKETKKIIETQIKKDLISITEKMKNGKDFSKKEKGSYFG